MIVRGGWLKRWVSLEFSRELTKCYAYLTYSADPQKGNDHHQITETTIVTAVSDMDGRSNCFRITSLDGHGNEKVHTFAAEDLETKSYWLLCLEAIIKRIASRKDPGIKRLSMIKHNSELQSASAVKATQEFLQAWMTGTSEAYESMFCPRTHKSKLIDILSPQFVHVMSCVYLLYLIMYIVLCILE